jgi:two-component system chemotaxis response regulator CheY
MPLSPPVAEKAASHEGFEKEETMALNVLVVDDSAVMRAMVIKTLRLSGLSLNAVHEAGNGAEALQVLDEQWVDLALVDINMPVMSGEELLTRIRQNPDTADLPIVVVSTEGSETRIHAIREHGVKFVHKPFSPEELRETIRHITGVSDAQLMADGNVTGRGPDF